MSILYKILEYSIWWVPILAMSSPIIWTVIYHSWYVGYRERKQKERWERIIAFFTKHGDKYFDAAASFGVAKFWASNEGYKTMRRIKKAEYESKLR